jgi:hypothetical protein
VNIYGAPIDSVNKPREQKAHWRLTGRIHSKAIFNFGGRVGSDNPTSDINFTYDRKQWGFLFFKGQDFYDHTTFYNFALVAVYKNFKLSPSITMTPMVGTFLEQANSVADKGSDMTFLLTTAFRLHPKLSIEHMSLFGNLVIEPDQRDWVNRVRLLYSGRHVDVIASAWHNNSIFDHSSYWSTGLSIAYSRVKLGGHAFGSVGISGLTMLYSSDEVLNPLNNVLMVTFGLQLVH